MFSSALNYIGLRLLGECPNDGEDDPMARARRWILNHGGVIGVPSWGKFWLAVCLLSYLFYMLCLDRINFELIK